MNSRPWFATFSLLFLFTARFLSWPLQATDERTADEPLAEPLTADNSVELVQAERPGQTVGPQSPANEMGPLFPFVEHGKWGYIDKTGKIVIPLQYYFAYQFSEGLAFIEPFPVLGTRAIRVQFIEKTG